MSDLFIGYQIKESPDGGVEEQPKHERLLLSASDLETHIHGIGGTRSGKSKLIEWIARELVIQKRGFCLIDPHGFLYDDLVKWFSYVKPPREIVLFNPSSTSRIVGFNPFLVRKGDLSTKVERMIHATIKAWGGSDTDETPTLERWLRCMYHVMVETGRTIEILPYLFGWTRRETGEFLTRQVTNPLIRDEWDALGTVKRMEDFDGQMLSSKNKLFRFLTSNQTRRIMGLTSNNLDLEDIIESGKILLVNLQPSDMLSQQQSRLIGTLLLNEIWEVGMRRKQAPGGKPSEPPFFLIIDEFQKFLIPEIPDMLDQAAKYGIHLMLFHQHLDQLRKRDEEAYSAVMTNARTKLVFGGLSRADARAMVEEIFPGQVDLKQIKYMIEQTKFWPVYTRDKVYSKGTGQVIGSSIMTGQAWDPSLQEWIASTGTGEMSSMVLQDGEADIPIFYPVPFKEISSIQTYSLDEVLWQMTDRLMEQYQRHFMIRRPGKPTVAAVTPFVKSRLVRPERTAGYVDELLGNYLTSAEVDQRLEEARLALEKEARAATEPEIETSKGPLFKPLKKRKKGS